MKKLLLLLSVFFVSSLTYAQAPDPGPDPGGSPGGGVPLDAGLTILLAAGAGYGVKKAYDYRNKSRKVGDSESQKD